MTTPLKRVSAKDAVINYIEEYITEHSLEQGMHLPSEEELVKSLGVSRSIVREALQYFKTLGIIDSKPKTGAYIKQLYPQNPFAGYMPFLKNSKERIQEIGQLRMIVEIGIIPLLLQKVTNEDLSELDEIIAQMDTCRTRDDMHELEIAFHGKLLAIVDNNILNGLRPLLLEFFDTIADVFNKSNPQTLKRTTDEHRSIVKAIRSKKEDQVIKLVKEHYSHYINLK